MSKLPSHLKLNHVPQQAVCLILEGDEEWYYFDHLQTLNIFSNQYKIKLINVKSASNIPAKYQEALSSDSYAIVLVVCDMDRVPKSYNDLVEKLKLITGSNDVEAIITFTRPCTLQIMLLHFGEVTLLTQAKKAAREDVKRLTGVENYDAHKDQLETICNMIFRRTWDEMMRRLDSMSKDSKDIPSTNINLIFDRLSSEDTTWINELNRKVLLYYCLAK